MCLIINFSAYFYSLVTLNLFSLQVNALLSSLDIDNDIRSRGPMPGRFPELEEYWNESQVMKPGPYATDGWVAEFSQHQIEHNDPNAWVQSFERQHGANGWATEFERVSSVSDCILQLTG